MTSWSPQEYPSGCWISENEYEAPGSTQTGKEFMIHATLEVGTEKFFSGIRVIIGCKGIREGGPADLTVNDNVGSSYNRDNKVEIFANAELLAAQQNGRKLAQQLQEGGLSTAGTLPLCTLVFEIVSKRDNTWERMNLILHPPQAVGQLSLHTLYECVELCTPSSKSLVIFLSINHSFEGSLKPNDPSGVHNTFTAPIGILAHGVQILPPSESRKPFINPPEEVLHIIFQEAVRQRRRNKWRTTLLSFALVCRAWRPALDHLFRDFGPYNTGRNLPDPTKLAKTVKMNPALGKKIRVFDPAHFGSPQEESVATYLDFGKAIVTILSHATMITNLHLYDIPPTLRQDFVHALSNSSNVETFLIYRRLPSKIANYRYLLSVVDILQCISHWPRLRKVSIYEFSAADDVENLPAPTCSLRRLLLHHGGLNLPQLRSLTSSSHTTLQDASLQRVSGLTNEDFRVWLLEVGPTLTSLTIGYTTLSRQPGEAYALDVVLPKMQNLQRLDLQGDIASELVLLRYAPCKWEHVPRWRQIRMLSIDNAPGVNAHGFVSALQSTEWTDISTRFFPGVSAELKEEAETIARNRNINFAHG